MCVCTSTSASVCENRYANNRKFKCTVIQLSYITKCAACLEKDLPDLSLSLSRLVGLVVKASASRAEDPGFESRLRRDFFGVESYQ